jgi:hypothetical protein
LIYLRYYHHLTQVPLLRQFIAWTGKVFSRIVLRQDKRVVTTQRSKKIALRMAENLFQGDLPIIEYRRRRQELIDQAQEQRQTEFGEFSPGKSSGLPRRLSDWWRCRES